MTIRYVGPGGSDAASGLTWALRKETLNGVEDTPVVAGDTVYIGPGVYRETLTCDITGTSGNLITYIGDVTGQNTDGVGGIVRITGLASEDAYPAIRSKCINIPSGIDYRAFRGFYVGEVTGASLSGVITLADIDKHDIFIENCVISTSAASYSDGTTGIQMNLTHSAGSSDLVIRKCFLFPVGFTNIFIGGNTSHPAPNSVIENCLVQSGSGAYHDAANVGVYQVNGVTIEALTALGGVRGVTGSSISPNLAVTDTLFWTNAQGIYDAADSVDEDYNAWSGSGTTEKDGANSYTTYTPFALPLLSQGFKMPWNITEPTAYCPDKYTTPLTTLTEDMYGLSRPGGAKFTPGAIQYKGVTKDTSEYHTSPSSIRMDDASKYIVSLPVNGTKKIRLSVFVKREADYAGTNPQLVVSLPSQGDATATDIGSSGAYNKLSVTVAPTAADRWLQLQLKSNNTATSGNYKVWFDEMKISVASNTIPTMRWATNEILLFCFSLEEVADPWISASIPIPTYGGEVREHYPLPSFLPEIG